MKALARLLRRPPPAEAPAAEDPGPAPASPLAAAVRAAAADHAWHAAAHRGWQRAALASIAATLVLALAFAAHLRFSSPVYITVAATPDGRVIELQPLSEPVRTDATLRNWAVAAVTEAFTLGHHDWERRLLAARGHFTDEGFESFVDALEESLFLDRLRDGYQVAEAAATGAPLITGARVLPDGRASWALEFPLLVTFHAGRNSESSEFVARALVVRAPRDERPAGVAIQQLVAVRAGTAR